MSLFSHPRRPLPQGGERGRRSPLPVFNRRSEKFGQASPKTPSSSTSRWYTILIIPMPDLPFGFGSRDGAAASMTTSTNGYTPLARTLTGRTSSKRRRTIRIPVPIPPQVCQRFTHLPLVVRIVSVLAFVLVTLLLLLGLGRNIAGHTTWNPPFKDSDTLVLTPSEIAKIWEWEVLSGHHPGRAVVPEIVPIQESLGNPVVPESALVPDRTKLRTTPPVEFTSERLGHNKHALVGEGPERTYRSPWETRLRNPSFPPRPEPGSIIDLDIIGEKCDFGKNKYVRDCLELLRVGGSLDNGKRVRHSNYFDAFRHIFVEDEFTPAPQTRWDPIVPSTEPRAAELSREALTLPEPNPVPASYASREDPCDPLHPRIFHMFWAGQFTDKPYMSVMSFLYTQNLGLDVPVTDSNVAGGTCRPQFWVWINPGPAAAVPNPSAKRDMFEQLATNPWSAPFLDKRFRDVVKFKMWNTTEQLDGVPELKDYWRDIPIFNSDGNVYGHKANSKQEETTDGAGEGDKENGLLNMVGSKSKDDYDRLSVILSDMARFVLTYRYGGIYLDADTLFLRDWEELWNYRGQFAYRWSWHAKYNTAVLKLHKGSALCTFLFKTALENGLDFHPMTVTRYLKDAGLDELLIRIPDALFDAAWLNMERYQRDRPPYPYFPEFDVFFSNDAFDSAGPEEVGFDGFFRGSYSYHFHNFWWLPFDPSRNFPDLGERFAKGRAALRKAQREAEASSRSARLRGTTAAAAARLAEAEANAELDEAAEDARDVPDLSWSTVLKRTFEAYLRGERPNMYGEWIDW